MSCFFLIPFLVNQQFALFQGEAQEAALLIAGDFRWLHTQKYHPLQTAVMRAWLNALWGFGELASGTDAAQMRVVLEPNVKLAGSPEPFPCAVQLSPFQHQGRRVLQL